jgi:hypothetical protein
MSKAGRSRNLPLPQGNQVAPVRIATHLRTVSTPHVPLKLVDRRRLRPAHHIERYGLVSVASEAPNFEIEVTGVQRVTQCRRRLRGTTEAEHALGLCVAREPIGFPAG